MKISVSVAWSSIVTTSPRGAPRKRYFEYRYFLFSTDGASALVRCTRSTGPGSRWGPVPSRPCHRRPSTWPHRHTPPAPPTSPSRWAPGWRSSRRTGPCSRPIAASSRLPSSTTQVIKPPSREKTPTPKKEKKKTTLYTYFRFNPKSKSNHLFSWFIYRGSLPSVHSVYILQNSTVQVVFWGQIQTGKNRSCQLYQAESTN